MRIRISLAALSLTLASSGFAQWPGNSLDRDSQSMGREGRVRGQIAFDAPVAGALTVEMTSFSHFTASTPARGDGSFEFEGLRPGQYDLRLTGAAGYVVYEESVLVTGGEQNLSLHVSLRSNTGPASTVSIQQLRHKVPSAAQKEFNKATTAARKGDHAVAVDHFRIATAIDPEFADAFSSLGSEYVAIGELETAAEQYQKAVDLVPDHSGAVPNLSIVLCKLQRYREAGQLARQALRIVPGLLRIRYVLGLSLLAGAGDRKEALDNLERAAPEIPEAHLLAAKILAEGGERDGAVKHLNDYLSKARPDSGERDKVQAWLTQLQN